MAKRNSQLGFGIIGVFAVLAVLAIAGGVGWLAYSNFIAKKSASVVSNHSGTTTSVRATPSPSATPDPYVGWKSYVLQNEKIKFKYPASWVLNDQTSSVNNEYDGKGQLIYTPGSDIVSITASDGLQVEIRAGTTLYGSGPDEKVISSTSIPMLGTTYYLNFIANSGEGDSETAGADILTSKTAIDDYSQFPTSKNIKLGPGAQNPANQGVPPPLNRILVWYPPSSNSGDTPRYPVSHYLNDSSYSDALNILKSMTY